MLWLVSLPFPSRTHTYLIDTRDSINTDIVRNSGVLKDNVQQACCKQQVKLGRREAAKILNKSILYIDVVLVRRGEKRREERIRTKDSLQK